MTKTQRARRSLRLLGEHRFLNFIRAVRGDNCFAVELINNALDEGSDVFSELCGGDQSGFFLVVTGRAPTFLIEFGCSPGPLVGDGGEWTVEFNDDDTVRSIQSGSQWTS